MKLEQESLKCTCIGGDLREIGSISVQCSDKISFTVYGSKSKFYQLTTSERSEGLTGFLLFRDLNFSLRLLKDLQTSSCVS